MQVIYEWSCGLDVHKRTVAACIRIHGADGEVVKEIKMFDTMTADLLVLNDWLASYGATHGDGEYREGFTGGPFTTFWRGLLRFSW